MCLKGSLNGFLDVLMVLKTSLTKRVPSYEARTLLLNGVSVSDTRIGVDTRMTLIGEVFNSKSIC